MTFVAKTGWRSPVQASVGSTGGWNFWVGKRMEKVWAKSGSNRTFQASCCGFFTEMECLIIQTQSSCQVSGMQWDCRPLTRRLQWWSTISGRLTFGSRPNPSTGWALGFRDGITVPPFSCKVAWVPLGSTLPQKGSSNFSRCGGRAKSQHNPWLAESGPRKTTLQEASPKNLGTCHVPLAANLT